MVSETHGTTGLRAYSIAKSFNKHFKSAGALNAGNVSQGLERERLKGADVTVGANTNEGAAKYYLTETGILMAKQLAKADAAA